MFSTLSRVRLDRGNDVHVPGDGLKTSLNIPHLPNECGSITEPNAGLSLGAMWVMVRNL